MADGRDCTNGIICGLTQVCVGEGAIDDMEAIEAIVGFYRDKVVG